MSMSMSMSMSILDLYSAIFSIALNTLIPCKQNSFQRALKVTAANSRLTQFDRQWIPDRRTPTEKARRPIVLRRYSIPRNSQTVQIGLTSMSAGDVGDRSAALDLVPWSFVLQTPTHHTASLYLLAQWVTLSQWSWSWSSVDSPRSYLAMQVTKRAAALSTRCKVSVM